MPFRCYASGMISDTLQTTGLFDDDLQTIRENDPKRAAALKAALEYEKRAAATTTPKLLSVDKMEEIIGEVVNDMAGDAGARKRAIEKGYRQVTLTGCAFRPTEVLGKHTLASFRRAVENSLSGDGGAIPSYRQYQEGTWVPIGYEIVRGYAVAEEPARKRKVEGEWADVPEERMTKSRPVATETLTMKVRLIDLAGGQNTVYAANGSGIPVDAQRVDVQVQQGGGGSNDAIVAQLMAQNQAMQDQMRALQEQLGARVAPAAPKPVSEHWRKRKAREEAAKKGEPPQG